MRRYFQGATWQECQTHFMRNILDKTPKVLQKEIHAKVRAIFEAPYAKTARMVLNKY
nr:MULTISPECIES: transposase [Thermoanaerobacter]